MMLTKTLSQTFTGVIWKMLLESNRKLIAIESRDSESRQTSFSVFNYQTGYTPLDKVQLDESWYVALSHIYQNLIFVTGYESERSPISKGITAINIDNKTTSWQRFNYSFYHAWSQGIQAYNPNISPRRFEWLSYETGEVIAVTNPVAINHDMQMPKIASQDILPDAINRENIVGDVMSLTYQDLIILSFHELFQQKLRLRLLVTSNYAIILDDILYSGIQKQQLETFFIQQNHLIYIQNGNQIVSYNLV